MQLQLGGCAFKVLYFADDDIWFEAKPLVLYLEYSIAGGSLLNAATCRGPSNPSLMVSPGSP